MSGENKPSLVKPVLSDKNFSNEKQTEEFLERRKRLKERIEASDKGELQRQPARQDFFHNVYLEAGDDAAAVPWADLCAKPELIKWLNDNPPSHKMRALDVACGLGDHASVMAQAGFETLGFDLVPKAIEWAKNRFKALDIGFEVADLFDLPATWEGRFDLVYECYTLQALAPELQVLAARSIANLVADKGRLLVYSRVIEEDQTPKGPPFPLPPSTYNCFENMGFLLKSRKEFTLEKSDGRKIPHVFDEWVLL